MAFAVAIWNWNDPVDTQDHKQALPPGFRLGSYRVVRVLGAGGFGVTYLCEHGGSGVKVAVKEYLPSGAAVRTGSAVVPKSPADRESYQWGLRRFLDEARTLARFEHRNVVRVRRYFEANGTAYIVMDYEDGEPLDRVLERTGTLNEAQLKHLLLPVVAGLQMVHAAGFLHRDVKPANIFIRRSDDSPVLLDFGAARQAMGHLSQSVTAIASAGYSPPEQYERSGKHGPWTDIYALSALCYRAVMGEAPIEAPRRQGQLLRGEDDPLPRLADIAAGHYSATFLLAVDHGLRVLETERPQSLAEWQLELTGRTVALMGTDELSLVFGDSTWGREPQTQTILGTEGGRTVEDDRQMARGTARPQSKEMFGHRPVSDSYTNLAKAFHWTTGRLRCGTARQQNRDSRRHSTTSERCTILARALRRTIGRQRCGIARPQSRDSRTPRTTLEHCISTGGALHRTNGKPRCGFARPQSRGTRRPRTTSV